MKKFLMVISISAIILLFLPIKGEALSCANPPDAKSEYERHDAVFRGETVEIKENTYTFKVKEVYKGDIPENFTADDAIGFWLSETVKLNGEYLVYAKYDAKEKRYTISPCSMTVMWERGKYDVEKFELNKSVKVIKKEQKEKQNTLATIVTILILGGICCLIILIVARNNFKRNH